MSRRVDVPIVLLVIVGLVVGVLGATWWSLEIDGGSGSGAASGAASGGDGWTKRGWTIGADTPADGAVVRITTTRCDDRIRGTGVVVDGAVLTNRHVVEGATEIVLTRADGSTTSVTSIDVASSVDLARLGAPGLPDGLQLTTRAADRLLGTPATLLGFPGGHDLVRRTVAVDSGHRGWGPSDPDRSWRLDAAVVPGESGSPLVDDADDVVGIVYARSNDDGAGLVISASELRRDVGRLGRVAFGRC